MSEKPILFSAPMVRAILDGTKTQTRRVIKPQPSPVAGHPMMGSWGVEWMQLGERTAATRNPYGQPGDHLWVRETFNADWCDHVIYRADGGSAKEAGYTSEPKWKPSVHMPRKCSRILLRVTDIRVELVQDITPADAKMEGDKERSGFPEFYRRGAECHVDWFADLWDSINAKRGFSWNSNPWVWAVTFEREGL